MNREQLKENLLSVFPEANLSENKQFVIMTIEADQIIGVSEKLLKTQGLLFDYLMCMTGTDWNTFMTITYHMYSTVTDQYIVVSSKINNRENPETYTVSHFWATAELHEREIREMLGINFINHPDPRNLLLPDDWKGFPMRKDYSDPEHVVEL